MHKCAHGQWRHNHTINAVNSIVCLLLDRLDSIRFSHSFCFRIYSHSLGRKQQTFSLNTETENTEMNEERNKDTDPAK